MKTILCRCTMALGVMLAPLAAPAHAWDLIPSLKLNVTFRVDVHSTAHPHPTAPWWAYFPQGAHEQAPASGPIFPHWPAQFPPAAHPVSMPHAPPAGPNVVFGPATTFLQPVGYYPAQAPSYWYGH